MIFTDRVQAGIELAKELMAYRKKPDTGIYGLARGGVIVAYAAAKMLELPLSVVVVRKVGAPFNEELALGAITDTGEGVFNKDLIERIGVSKQSLEKEIARQKRLAQERVALYQGTIPSYPIQDHTIILVDDGIATGASMRVAIAAMRKKGAKKIIVAVPVGPADTIAELKREVDDVICLHAPKIFEAVGYFYKEFGQTSDEEIIGLFRKKSA